MGDDDDKEEETQDNYWTVIGHLNEMLDNAVPGTGNLFDMTRSLAKGESGIDTMFTRTLAQLKWGIGNIDKGVAKDNDARVVKGVVQIGESLGLLAGAPVGGPVQVAKVLSGLFGHSFTNTKQPNRKPAPRRPASSRRVGGIARIKPLRRLTPLRPTRKTP